MTDIYQSALEAKYQDLLRVQSVELAFGNDLTVLTADRLKTVQYDVDRAIFEWATRRRARGSQLRPMSNMQHLLEEYCAIADHL